MMKRTAFMSFVYKAGLPDIRMLSEERIRVLGEMAAGVSTKEPTPFVPDMVRNLLMMVRGGRANMGRVLRWVYEDGLFEATRGRKIMAQVAQKEFQKKLEEKGLPPDKVFIPEDKLFFQEAWPSMAKRFTTDPEMQAYFTNNFMPWVVKEYNKHYEPKQIELPSVGKGGGFVISIPELNASLPPGVKPFSFGPVIDKSGQIISHGLIEHMENGDWSGPTADKEPYGTDDPIRDGVDLRDPQWVMDPAAEKYHYRYAPQSSGNPGWSPPMSNDAYSDIVSQMIKHGAQQAHSIKDKIGDSNFVHEDDPELAHWLRHHGENLKPVGAESAVAAGAEERNIAEHDIAELFGFGRRSTGGAMQVPPETEAYLRKLISAGIDVKASTNKPEYGPLKNQIIQWLLPGNGVVKNYFIPATLAKAAQIPTTAKPGTKDYPKHLVNAGAKALGLTRHDILKAGVVPNKDLDTPTEFRAPIDDSAWSRRHAEHDDSQVIDVPNYLQDGWQFIGDPDGSTARLVKRTATGSGSNHLDMKRHEDGQWHLIAPKMSQVDPNQLAQSGWQWDKKSGSMGSMVQKDPAGKVTGRMFLQKSNGQWYDTHKTPVGSDPDSPPVMNLLGRSRLERDAAGNYTHNLGTRKPHASSKSHYGFADDAVSQKAANDLIANPGAYGEDPLTPDETRKANMYFGPMASKFPPSFIKGAISAIQKVISTGNTSLTPEQLKAIQEELPQEGFLLLPSLVNNPNFRFGDLDKQYKVKGYEHNPDQFDQNEMGEVKAIDQELMKVGIEDPKERAQWIEKMKKLREGDSKALNQVPPAVKEAFLRNGFKWRKHKIASLLRGTVRHLIDTYGAEDRHLGDMGGKNKEGDVQGLDVSTDDKGIRDRIAMADKNRENRRVELLNMGAGGETRQDVLRRHRGLPSLRDLLGDNSTAVASDSQKGQNVEASQTTPFHDARVAAAGGGLPGWEKLPSVDQWGQKVNLLGKGQKAYLGTYRNTSDKIGNEGAATAGPAILKLKFQAEQDPNRKAGIVDGIADGLSKLIDTLRTSMKMDPAQLNDLKTAYGLMLDPSGSLYLGGRGADESLLETLRKKVKSSPALSTIATTQGQPADQATPAQDENPSFPVLTVNLPDGQVVTYEQPSQMLDALKDYDAKGKAHFSNTIRAAARQNSHFAKYVAPTIAPASPSAPQAQTGTNAVAPRPLFPRPGTAPTTSPGAPAQPPRPAGGPLRRPGGPLNRPKNEGLLSWESFRRIVESCK